MIPALYANKLKQLMGHQAAEVLRAISAQIPLGRTKASVYFSKVCQDTDMRPSEAVRAISRLIDANVIEWTWESDDPTRVVGRNACVILPLDGWTVYAERRVNGRPPSLTPSTDALRQRRYRERKKAAQAAEPDQKEQAA